MGYETDDKVYSTAQMLAWVGCFAERMSVSPEKIKFINTCNRKKNVLPTIETHKRVMIFADQDRKDLFYELWEAGYGELDIWFARGLDVNDEIKSAKLQTVMNYEITEPTVVFIVNEKTREASRFGIKNEFFSRGHVRYVGHEIRAVIMSMIACDVQDTICIVSGESIVIEAAIAAADGTIIAVEPDRGSMDAMYDNVAKFGVHNVEIIGDLEEETLSKLPVPRLAFIVATKHVEEDIIKLKKINPNMQFIIYTLELDIMCEMKHIFERQNLDIAEMFQISVSRLAKDNTFAAQPTPWLIRGEAK